MNIQTMPPGQFLVLLVSSVLIAAAIAPLVIWAKYIIWELSDWIQERLEKLDCKPRI